MKSKIESALIYICTATIIGYLLYTGYADEPDKPVDNSGMVGCSYEYTPAPIPVVMRHHKHKAQWRKFPTTYQLFLTQQKEI